MNLTNDNTKQNKDFIDKEILNAVWCRLELLDFNEEEVLYRTEINLDICNLCFEIELYGISLEAKNRYTFDGETIGKSIKEKDHTYNFNTLWIKNVWCESIGEYLELDIVKELNEKYSTLWKL